MIIRFPSEAVKLTNKTIINLFKAFAIWVINANINKDEQIQINTKHMVVLVVC